jgi:hypothetical protein
MVGTTRGSTSGIVDFDVAWESVEEAKIHMGGMQVQMFLGDIFRGRYSVSANGRCLRMFNFSLALMYSIES